MKMVCHLTAIEDLCELLAAQESGIMSISQGMSAHLKGSLFAGTTLRFDQPSKQLSNSHGRAASSIEQESSIFQGSSLSLETVDQPAK